MCRHHPVFLFVLALLHNSVVAQFDSLTLNMTRAQVAFEEVLIVKHLADEHFINEERTEATKNYDEALRIFKRDVFEADDIGKDPMVKLLKAELDYRSTLVRDPRADFWGSCLAINPTDPVKALRRLTDRAEELKKLTDDVSARVNDLLNNQGVITIAQVEQARGAAQERVSTLMSDRSAEIQDFHEQRMEKTRWRLGQIHDETEKLAVEQRRLFEQMDQLASNLNGIAISTIGKAAGIPVDLNAVANGQLKTALIQASSAAANSPEFGSALRGVNETAGRILDVYQQANDVNAKLQQGRQAVEDVRDLVRKPTFEGLANLGGLIYEQLDRSGKEKWERFVIQTKSIVALVEVAHRRPLLKEALLAYFQANGVVLPTGPISDAEFEVILDRFALQWGDLNVRSEGLKNLFDKILDRLNGDVKAMVIRDLTEYQLALAQAMKATEVQQSLPLSSDQGQQIQRIGSSLTAAAAPGEFASLTETNADEGSAAIKGVLTGALTTICPQLAFAQVGLKMLDGVQAMNLKAAQLNDIADRMERFSVEEMELRDMVEASMLERANAQYERDIAQVRREEASQELGLWHQRIDQAYQVADRKRRYITYSLSLLFYLAEELRHDFARLDLSVAMWTGAIEKRSGSIQRNLENDLSLMRLALDEDIHLYEWLTTERAIESRRDDIEQLAFHWQKVVTVSNDVLNNLGVTTAGGMIGTITQTAGDHGTGLSLRSLVDSIEWSRFADWQEKGRQGVGQPAAPYVLALPILPGGLPGGEPIVTLQAGLRVVTVRLGEQRGPGDPVLSNRVELIHPGFAYVPAYDHAQKCYRFVIENYQPQSSTLSPPTAGSGDANLVFESRWQPTSPRNVFDGYGLFTTWYLKFEPVASNFTLQDLQIKFIYQYYHSEAVADIGQKGYSETFLRNGVAMQVDGRYLTMLGKPEDIQRKAMNWQAPTGAELPPCSFGEPVSTMLNFWENVRTRTDTNNPVSTWLVVTEH